MSLVLLTSSIKTMWAWYHNMLDGFDVASEGTFNHLVP